MDRVARPLVLVLSTLVSAMLPMLAQEPHVARYELKLTELKYDYGIATPVLRLQPGMFWKRTRSTPMVTRWKMPASNPRDRTP